jgi:hypothetical protein
VLEKVTQHSQHFKIIANCLVLPRTGFEINCACACFWDDQRDGTLTIRRANHHFICILTLYACAS